MWDEHLGEININLHQIDLTAGAKPVTQRAHRTGPKAKEFVAEEVKRMHKAYIIDPSTSERTSSVVIVPKHYGSYPMCIDFRKRNAVTIHGTYPLPRMDEQIDFLRNATVFLTLEGN